jgi:hypothetical protein
MGYQRQEEVAEGNTSSAEGHPDYNPTTAKNAGASKESNGPSPLYPNVSFQLEDRYIDEPRALRVVVIGAGLAGITAGILFPAKVPGINLTIFEKNEDVVSSTSFA